MSRGVATTEFWCMVFVQVSSMFGLLAGVYSGHLSAAMIALSTTAYIISRGIAKRKGG